MGMRSPRSLTRSKAANNDLAFQSKPMLDENGVVDWDAITIKGTSTKLEKDYLRLTQVRFLFVFKSEVFNLSACDVIIIDVWGTYNAVAWTSRLWSPRMEFLFRLQRTIATWAVWSARYLPSSGRVRNVNYWCGSRWIALNHV